MALTLQKGKLFSVITELIRASFAVEMASEASEVEILPLTERGRALLLTDCIFLPLCKLRRVLIDIGRFCSAVTCAARCAV